MLQLLNLPCWISLQSQAGNEDLEDSWEVRALQSMWKDKEAFYVSEGYSSREDTVPTGREGRQERYDNSFSFDLPFYRLLLRVLPPQ